MDKLSALKCLNFLKIPDSPKFSRINFIYEQYVFVQ